jgi:integrase
MSRGPKVILSSNNGYWQASYYDSLGRRRKKSLGPKNSLSRRQAQALCERLAVELNLSPSRADVAKAPPLSRWTDSFLALKPDLSDSARKSYRLASTKLADHIGKDTTLDRVTAMHAAEWVASLSNAGLSPASVANYSRHVRCLFNEATRQGLLVTSPFSRIRTQPKRIDREWHYVSRAEFTRILATSKNSGWSAFLALQRIAGLRRGEALKLEWSMVDFDRRVLRLSGGITKTGRERIVPIDPELFALLLAAKEVPGSATSYVVAPELVDRKSGSNQHARFETIIKKAGLERWEDLFQTLRRNAVQDLRQKLKDPWAVTAIAGHSEEVERKYYLGRVRQSDLDQITGQGSSKDLQTVIDRWASLSERIRSDIVRLALAAEPPAP